MSRGEQMKNILYNLFIREVSLLCYRTCLDYVPGGSRILDVGIGNGAMIQEFHETIRSKGISITGIDVDRCYLDHCERQIRKNSLEEYVNVFHVPVERFEPEEPHSFDFVLFSMSFMLLDDPALVLRRIRRWVRPSGGVMFFQTMFARRSLLLDIVKPRLRYLTTVEFGRVVYDDEFFGLLRREGVSVVEDVTVAKAWFGGRYRFVVCRPETAADVFTLPKAETVGPGDALDAPHRTSRASRPLRRNAFRSRSSGKDVER